MSDEALDPQLSAFENKLRALAPRGQNFNRDRLLYLAGRASIQRVANLWRMCALGSTLAAAGLFGLVCVWPVRDVHHFEIVPLAPTVQQPHDSGPLADAASDLSAPRFERTHEPFNQLELRKLAFQHGVDALPQQSFPDVDEHRQTFSGQHILSAGSQSLESANP